MDPGKHLVIPPGSNHHDNARKANRNLQWLGEKMPPRIGSAVFSTLWNRWTTQRRFQKRGPCLLACGSPDGDSIEHYSRCPVTKRLCRQHLHLDPEVFATLHAFVLAHPSIWSQEDLATLGVLIYSVYNVTNRIRSQGASSEIVYDALVQMCREGVKGDPYAMKILAARWPSSTNTRLPAVSLLPWTKKTKKLREQRNQM